jgi:hypothetical protein
MGGRVYSSPYHIPTQSHPAPPPTPFPTTRRDGPHQTSAEQEPESAFPVAVGLPASFTSEDSRDGSEAQQSFSNNPYDENYVNAIATMPIEGEKVYTWLTCGRTASVARLRAYCKGMGLRQLGKKRTLIFLLLLSASQRVVGGTTQWKNIFSPEFAAWVSDPVTITTQKFYSAPPDAKLQMFRPAPTSCASATCTGDELEPSFSVNEFARICNHSLP